MEVKNENISLQPSIVSEANYNCIYLSVETKYISLIVETKFAYIYYETYQLLYYDYIQDYTLAQ